MWWDTRRGAAAAKSAATKADKRYRRTAVACRAPLWAPLGWWGVGFGFEWVCNAMQLSTRGAWPIAANYRHACIRFARTGSVGLARPSIREPHLRAGPPTPGPLGQGSTRS